MMDWFGCLFLIEVTIGGLLSGVMYALFTIGFVLIYKTSGVLNFGQGTMVLFAALTFGGFDSVLGAIVAGLAIGATEKIAEVYRGSAGAADPSLRPTRPENGGADLMSSLTDTPLHTAPYLRHWPFADIRALYLGGTPEPVRI